MAVACDGDERSNGDVERFRWKALSVQPNAESQVIGVYRQFDDTGDEIVIEAHEVIARNHQQPVVRLAGEPLLKPCGKPGDLGGESLMPGGSQLLAALTNPTIEGRGDIGIEVCIVRGRGNRHTPCRLGAVKVGVDGEGGPSHMTGQPSDGELLQRARLVPSCRHLGRCNDRPDSSERIEEGSSYRSQFGFRLPRSPQSFVTNAIANGPINQCTRDIGKKAPGFQGSARCSLTIEMPATRRLWSTPRGRVGEITGQEALMPVQKQWVFDPDSGGVKITDAVFPSGGFFGTPEDAFEVSAGRYLA